MGPDEGGWILWQAVLHGAHFPIRIEIIRPCRAQHVVCAIFGCDITHEVTEMEALARSGPGAVLVETGEGRFAFGGVIVKVPSHLLLMPLRNFQGYLVVFLGSFHTSFMCCCSQAK